MNAEVASISPIMGMLIWTGQYLICLSVAMLVVKAGEWVEARISKD